jgi:hypothetical protein
MGARVPPDRCSSIRVAVCEPLFVAKFGEQRADYRLPLIMHDHDFAQFFPQRGPPAVEGGAAARYSSRTNAHTGLRRSSAWMSFGSFA